MLTYFAIAALVTIGGPILAYFVMKFGTAGYLRARQLMEKQTKKNDEIQK